MNTIYLTVPDDLIESECERYLQVLDENVKCTLVQEGEWHGIRLYVLTITGSLDFSDVADIFDTMLDGQCLLVQWRDEAHEQ